MKKKKTLDRACGSFRFILPTFFRLFEREDSNPNIFLFRVLYPVSPFCFIILSKNEKILRKNVNGKKEKKREERRQREEALFLYTFEWTSRGHEEEEEEKEG